MELDMGSENEGKANGNPHLDLCSRNDAIGRSDCEMKWLVGGLLGFAIFVVTLADQDGHENDANHLTKQKLTEDDALLHANLRTLSNVISLNAESASIKMTSGQTAPSHCARSINRSRLILPRQSPIPVPRCVFWIASGFESFL